MPLQQIYSHAARLHRVLSRVWTCSAHSSHEIYLLLEQRLVRKVRKRQMRTRGGGDHSGTAIWNVAEVKVREQQVLPPRMAGVVFHVNMKIIQDLCSTFTSHSHLGFCLDLASQGVLLGRYSAAQRSVMLGHNLVTLEDILMTQRKWRAVLHETFYVRWIAVLRRWLCRLLDWPVASRYVRVAHEPLLDTGYLLLDYIAPTTGQMLSQKWQKQQTDEGLRLNLHRGISHLLLPLARLALELRHRHAVQPSPDLQAGAA